ncbi:transmembrane cytochrome oxidase associated protein [Pseudoalteromonas denitrificans]|uniref:Transmembrane cytochrome oxidase associated protein n=1 Tax=Pseudoalteromonas denitrificans DSM 6059 TaxID=1123010 RepID=A0A1I1RP43_9GAMM|nr:transmembrane cytochrome oxidase associated protein [Pseudoalteromonas denitrificans]SFD36109.1 hypothetical protein SAMN02745724_04295 [Pseudoalteromonas denitrificans DSM 6059]
MTNKKTISIFVFSFIVPLVLAYIVLKLNLIPTNTVNQGEFLTEEIKLQHWSEIKPKAWSIGLVEGGECNTACLNHREEVKNLYLALGKNQGKVDLVLIGEQGTKDLKFKNYKYTAKHLKSNSLYLIDHMGLVVLAYPVVQDIQTNRVTNKGLMKDLKKLLNYARNS